jgi:hypothetical protein
MPVPIVLLALLADYSHVVSASLALPILTILAMPVPTALWWMVLWPAVDPEADVVRIGWRKYTPHVSSAVIPPRRSRDPMI